MLSFCSALFLAFESHFVSLPQGYAWLNLNETSDSCCIARGEKGGNATLLSGSPFVHKQALEHIRRRHQTADTYERTSGFPLAERRAGKQIFWTGFTTGFIKLLQWDFFAFIGRFKPPNEFKCCSLPSSFQCLYLLTPPHFVTIINAPNRPAHYSLWWRNGVNQHFGDNRGVSQLSVKLIALKTQRISRRKVPQIHFLH